VTAVEAGTGVVPDEYAQRQQADLERRRDAMLDAAEEFLDDPGAVAEAIADDYAARYELADTLEEQYRAGHADLDAFYEAERIRAQANAELTILGVEVGATVVGAGAIVRGLRTARTVDNLQDATPVAAAMASTERTREMIDALDELVEQPGRTDQIGLDDIRAVESEVADTGASSPSPTGGADEADWFDTGEDSLPESPAADTGSAGTVRRNSDGRAIGDDGRFIPDPERPSPPPVDPVPPSAVPEPHQGSPWSNPNAPERGRQIEQRLGQNLPSAFPTIDRFENGHATSIKSVDLRASSYQSPVDLENSLYRHVESVRDFDGADHDGVSIEPGATTSRELVIAVEPGVMSDAQRAALDEVVEYGASLENRVDVTIVEVE
ncbi:MAG: hypothetical protein AAFP84_11170, partial [Actinomycetota bacterium]